MIAGNEPGTAATRRNNGYSMENCARPNLSG